MMLFPHCIENFYRATQVTIATGQYFCTTQMCCLIVVYTSVNAKTSEDSINVGCMLHFPSSPGVEVHCFRFRWVMLSDSFLGRPVSWAPTINEEKLGLMCLSVGLTTVQGHIDHQNRVLNDCHLLDSMVRLKKHMRHVEPLICHVVCNLFSAANVS